MNYVCHTQAVEHGIKGLSKVAAQFIKNERDGVFIAINASKKSPHFAVKKISITGKKFLKQKTMMLTFES